MEQKRCVVPEHSPSLLEALSGGKPFTEGDYLFAAADDWLLCVGYPIQGAFSVESFENALREALRRTKARSCFAIAPEFPERLKSSVIDSDVYYDLPASAPVPAKVRGPVQRAGLVLRVEEANAFTAAHRRLWAEFFSGRPLSPRIRQLYATTPAALLKSPELRFLNAWDDKGRLSGCLLLDWSLPGSVSYVLGAHSREAYVPHAHDLLFAEMLRLARERGRETVLLGLGVNEGITRFKRKWGAIQGMPYRMAAWEEDGAEKSAASLAVAALLGRGSGMSCWKYFETLPEQRPCAMLWKLEKGGRVSWIAGSAHFFCCSFENSLRRLFEDVDTVLLEGPMDSDSLAEVARTGRDPGPDSTIVGGFLTEQEIQRLEKRVWGPQGFWARLAGMEQKEKTDLRHILFHCRHWYSFFAAWTAYLERNGWKQSVDLEVWNTAMDMGKEVMGMESLAEQIASLESAPVERVVRFLQDCDSWPRMMRSNHSRYLAGDLAGMMGTSAEFPTRTSTIIDKRDQRFRERMRPYVERGGTAVFVGTAHMINLRRMLAEDGFTVSRVLPTWKHRFFAWLHHDPEDVIPGNPHASGIAGDAAALRHAGPAAPAAPAGASSAGQSGIGSGSLLAGMEMEALVPEQIPAYVRAVSGRRLCECGGFPAWLSDSDMVLVAFPMQAGEAQEEFARKVENAVAVASTVPKMQRITVLCPFVPASAPPRATVKTDTWQVIDLPHIPAQKLRNMLRRAERDVAVRREEWSDECAGLVHRYLLEKPLDSGTRHIFSRVGDYVKRSPLAILYAARSREGRLEGIAVGDHSALDTAFYMFAFRRSDSPPGTGDLLLDAIAREAVERGQRVLNLGLGIDSGISFFKKKWGARELMPHTETTWSLL